MIKVALVDDHPIVVDGLSEILRQQDGIEVVGAFTQGHELYDLLASQQVDVVLLDINMPGIDGFDIIDHIKAKHPGVKMLTLTMLNDGPTLRRIIDSGAHGYIEKNASQAKIVEAINEVHFRGHFLENEITQKLVAENKAENDGTTVKAEALDISDREKEVIKCILQKMKNKKIAESLFISENTVRSHKKNIFRKFDVGNTQELLIEIHKQGLEF